MTSFDAASTWQRGPSIAAAMDCWDSGYCMPVVPCANACSDGMAVTTARTKGRSVSIMLAVTNKGAARNWAGRAAQSALSSG